MKRLKIALVVVCLSLPLAAPVEAATKASVLTSAFQKYLTDGEQKYSAAMAAADKLYVPQITDAQAKLSLAQAEFTNVNQVVVLNPPPPSNNALRNYMSALKCPANNDCSTAGTLTGGYPIGSMTTINGFIGGGQAFQNDANAQLNLGILQSVDLGVSNGLFKLVDANGFSNMELILRSQYQIFVTLAQQYIGAQNSARSDRDYVRSMQPTIANAILSIKRAAASSAIFDKAFVTSMKFEYNRKRLDDIARQPWTYITSLKALGDAVWVTKQSLKADSVSAHYSYSAATALNVTFAKLFLSEPLFIADSAVVSGIYKSATGVKLSFN